MVRNSSKGKVEIIRGDSIVTIFILPVPEEA